MKLENGNLKVTDGPFTETKELIAGFWIVDVKSRDEAIAWVKKVPLQEGEEIEIRKVFEASDWEDGGIDPALIEQERKLRETVGS